MKILPWSAAALVAMAGFAVGCGTGGCGGTNVNDNSNSAPTITCGPGTAQQGGICVPTGSATTH